MATARACALFLSLFATRHWPAAADSYFDHHFPMAVTVGAALRALPGAGGRAVPDRLNFMFQSWVVSMYLDCPTGMGLHCPTTAQASAFEGAIKAGDVTWHAFPHNAELEMMDPSLIEAGLALTWALDDRFGLPRKQTLSQRDVPGMTRSLIPLLTKAGVTAISIGVNTHCTALHCTLHCPREGGTRSNPCFARLPSRPHHQHTHQPSLLRVHLMLLWWPHVALRTRDSL